MKLTRLESELLRKLGKGLLDGFVGDYLTTSGGSTVWTEIKNGTPMRLKEGPGGKFFNGKENERFKGATHVLQKWSSDEEKVGFLRKFGFLMKDDSVKKYSSLFKPKR